MINKISKIILLITVAIFPAFVLNLFTNSFDTPKILLLSMVIVLLLVLMGIETALNGKLTIKTSPLDIPLLLLTLSAVISGIIKTPNKMEVFFLPGSALVFILGFILYFFVKNVFDKDKKDILNVFFFSGVLVSLYAILSFLNVFEKTTFLPSFLKDPSFSPLGGKLAEIVFLTAALPIGVIAIIKDKEMTKKIFFGLCLLISVMALTLDVSFVLPGKGTTPVLPGIKESFSVATTTIKQSPILGIGSGNYQTAFSKYVPVSHNQSPYWQVRFSSAISYVLTLATETGLIGLISFLAAIFFVVKMAMTKHKDQALIPLGIITLSFFFLPGSLTLIILFFILLGIASKDKELVFKVHPLSSLAVFFLIGAIMFFGGRAFFGEMIYKTALDAIVKNDGKTAYDHLRTAIEINPYIDRYHLTYSQVNIALAESVAQKKDITEKEKETVAQLIQQAIREGKASVSLNPQRSTTWENLAKIYRKVIPLAQGADQFTIETFTQAIALDPINPNLRIALGETLFALGRYDEAIKLFEIATIAKPDLANAHFNLALAYQQKKELDKAIQEMNKVITLVKKDSSDYQLALQALENLKKNKALQSEGTENLTPPQTIENEPVTEVNLQEGDTPPTQ